MHDSTSTTGPQRPRTRRGLGVLVGVTLMATPLAVAPAAQAQLQLRASPDLVQQIVALVGNILSGLGHTLQFPLGEKAPNTVKSCQIDGIGTLGTCLVAPLQDAVSPGQKAKAKVKASVKSGKVTVRRVR